MPLQPPGDLPAAYEIPEVQAAINNMLSCTFTGNGDTLKKDLTAFIKETGINELMISTNVFDTATKLKSYTILKDALYNE